MDSTPLNTEPRPDSGKGSARKLRAKGLTPAVMYRAGEPATHFAVSPKEIQTIFRKSGNPNLILSLMIDGKSVDCILKDYHKHPVSREVLHCDFYALKKNEGVPVEILVRVSGKAEGETLGGKIRFLRRTIRVIAKPADIPAEFTIDISGMDVGDFIRAGDVELPKGVTLGIDARTNIIVLHGKSVHHEEEEEEATAVEETPAEA
jgi:large subunit ribosomal protein L25